MSRSRKRWRWAITPVVLVWAAGDAALAQPPADSAAGEQQRPVARQQAAAGDADAEADLQLVSALERVLARAIARAEKSVVSIARRSRAAEYARRDAQPDLLGMAARQAGMAPSDPRDPDFVPNEFATGVVIDASGLVLTNAHVIDIDSDHFVTTVDHKVFEMQIKAADPRSDLAVLALKQPRLKSENDFVPISFGNAAGLRKGQIVISLGNPYAIARDGQASASWGIISNLARKAGTEPRADQLPAVDATKTLHQFGTLIQTDAKLNLGTSGGALLNLRGEMIGLTTSLAASAGYELPAGYAIPVDDTFRRIVETLKQGREVEYGLLGIVPQHLHPLDVLKGLHGALVERAQPGQPAARYGVEDGDIVTHVDGRPIYDADGLKLHVGKLPPAATTTLTILRGGQTLQRRVVLSKYPLAMEQIVTERPPAWRGLRVDYPTVTRLVNPGEIVDFGQLSGFTGVCVAARDVDTDSPAWRAGLRPGTRISHVGSIPVETPEEFRRAVADKAGPVRLRIIGPDGEWKAATIEPQ